MKSTLLNVSGKISNEIIVMLETVDRATSGLAIPYMLVGAAARDVVLHYGHGLRIQRATVDIDVGIQVLDWERFAALKNKLVKEGFNALFAPHRLLSPKGIPLDIVPFGGVEDENANISWPPDCSIKMNVLGFREACQHAGIVRIQQNPDVDIPVLTPPAMVLLKLIAWTDRPSEIRRKDAQDIRYLLANYENISSIFDEIFEDNTLVDMYQGDTTMMGAHLLGEHCGALAAEKTNVAISRIAQSVDSRLNQVTLVEEMCQDIEDEFERCTRLFSAFINGFNRR